MNRRTEYQGQPSYANPRPERYPQQEWSDDEYRGGHRYRTDRPYAGSEDYDDALQAEYRNGRQGGGARAGQWNESGDHMRSGRVQGARYSDDYDRGAAYARNPRAGNEPGGYGEYPSERDLSGSGNYTDDGWSNSRSYGRQGGMRGQRSGGTDDEMDHARGYGSRSQRVGYGRGDYDAARIFGGREDRDYASSSYRNPGSGADLDRRFELDDERSYRRSYSQGYGQDRGLSSYGDANDRSRQYDQSRAMGRGGSGSRGASQWSDWQGNASPYGDTYPSGMSSGDQGNYAGYGSYGEPGYERVSRRAAGFSGLGPKGYKRSDERIKEDINERLTDDALIDASDVSVEVREGKVALNGHVVERWMKHHIEDLIDRCAGVRDIDNRLSVGRPASSTGQHTSSSSMGSGAASVAVSSSGTGTSSTQADNGQGMSSSLSGSAGDTATKKK